MEESEFDRLLERYLAGEATDQEKARLEAWLDVNKSEEDPRAFQMTRGAEDRLFRRIEAKIGVKELTAYNPSRDRSAVLQWTLRIAASLLIISVISYFVWDIRTGARGTTAAVSGDAVRKLILNDGSLVWLKGKSTLAYYEKKDEGIRYAELKGEGLFEVAKDPGRPFVVRCGAVSVRVLGTSFSIRTGADTVELNVLTGRVNLSSDQDPAGIEITPHERVIYAAGRVERLRIDEGKISALTEHTEYDMKFANARLEEVLERIGEKFDIPVTIADGNAGRCTITADFTDHSLESSLKMIAEVLEVTCAVEGGRVTVSGTGCSTEQ